jgi:hypothetical protein
MMSDITLETCWTIDISGIINSVTELHLVGDLLLIILRCTVPWIFNLNEILNYGARLLQHLLVWIPKDIFFCSSFLFHTDVLSSETVSFIPFVSSLIIHTEILHFIYCFLTYALTISYSSVLNEPNNPSTVVYSCRNVGMKFFTLWSLCSFKAFIFHSEL